MAKRLMMVCAALVAATSVSAAITSRSYVQGGLVAQYDGINNAGHDVAHSDSTATWTDLTGHGNDGTVGANVVWCENGWTNGVAGKPISVGFGLSRVTGTGTFTAQFACKPVSKSVQSGRASFFSQYSASRSLGIEHRGTSISDCIRVYSMSLGTSVSSKSSGMTVNTWGSVTVTADNGLKDVGFYKNLEDWGKRHFSSDSGNLNTACVSVIGGENDREAMAFFGTYNAFRLYDRVLPEDEIKINAAVDAVRFNGADWSDYPELAAYSFATDGTLQQNLIAVAAEGGNVRVGDDAAATAVTGATANYGSGEISATFTAVPDSGSVFYRWEGDTAAITSGSYLSPTITVTSEKGVLLTAVFRQTRRGLTSLSYVTPGIVAQYDGIDNAGYGQHDSSATTWADLSGNGNDATKAADVTWAANGWQNSANCYPMTVSSGKVSATTASKVFTMQYAVKPSRHDVRQCFFGQYDKRGFSLEHNSGSSNPKTGYMRYYYFYVGSGSGDASFTDITVQTDEWASMSFLSDTKKQTVWKNGATSSTKTTNLSGTLTNLCNSVIGGDNSRIAMAFRGTYNAFRLYNRVLTEDEVKVNAAVDAIRFNGASASSYTLGGGYSFASDSTLMIAMTAAATTGGKVALKRVGTFASTVSSTVNQDGSEITGFVAQHDEGYIFYRWTGDIDTIVKGSVLTPEIGVVSTRPVVLTAEFRKPGSNALDGMVLDLDIRDVEDGALLDGTNSGYHIGDALHAGSPRSNSYYTCWYSQPNGFNDYRPMYKFVDVPTPITPFTTNAAQPCIYLTQKKDDSTGKVGLSRWELGYTYVDAPVATFYVRFFWEGPLVPGIANDSCIFCNGYTTWKNIGEGFTLRIRTPSGGGANDNMGFLNVFIPNEVPTVDYGTDLYITTNSWVDCFVSVYPSPTNFEFSNVDIWFCQTPALDSNGIFGYPVLKHKHMGDECKLPRFRSIDKAHAIRLGAETSGTNTDPEYIRKAFRGYYGGLKAWDRLLTEKEMWSVMAGQYGGTFSIGVENGSADEFGGKWYGRRADPFDVATNKWQEMKKSLTAADRTLTLVAPIPEESEGLPRVLEIVPLFDGVGASCPVTVTANGAEVGTFDLMNARKRAIPLGVGQVRRDANGKLTITITRPEGCTGTLSFDALSLAGSWQIGKINGTSGDMTQQGQGVSSVVIAGDPNYKHAQRAVTTTYNTLTIPFDVPKKSVGQCAYRYETSIDSVKPGNTHPIHLEFNGETMWSSENATTGRVRVEIPAESVKAGLNEMKWVYDTTTASNWVTFDYHRMKMILPSGITVIIR